MEIFGRAGIKRVIIQIVVIIIFLVTLLVRLGLGCSCDKPASAKLALAGSSSVFSGKVIEIKSLMPKPIIYGSFPRIKYWQIVWGKQVTFQVNQIWKGNIQSHITVFPSRFCPPEFEEGKEYLIYTNNVNGIPYVFGCSRSSFLANAIEDINELGQSIQPTLSENKVYSKQILVISSIGSVLMLFLLLYSLKRFIE